MCSVFITRATFCDTFTHFATQLFLIRNKYKIQGGGHIPLENKDW